MFLRRILIGRLTINSDSLEAVMIYS